MRKNAAPKKCLKFGAFSLLKPPINVRYISRRVREAFRKGRYIKMNINDRRDAYRRSDEEFELDMCELLLAVSKTTRKLVKKVSKLNRKLKKQKGGKRHGKKY